LQLGTRWLSTESHPVSLENFSLAQQLESSLLLHDHDMVSSRTGR